MPRIRIGHASLSSSPIGFTTHPAAEGPNPLLIRATSDAGTCQLIDFAGMGESQLRSKA
jgi:hypothetical protein